MYKLIVKKSRFQLCFDGAASEDEADEKKKKDKEDDKRKKEDEEKEKRKKVSNALHACCILTSMSLLYTHSGIQIEECVVAIIDSTIDRDAGVIHHEVLEVDDEGNTPNRVGFRGLSHHSIMLITRNPQKLKVQHDMYSK